MTAMQATAPPSRDAARADEDEEHQPEPELLAHDYDGIREYDNPLPGWWRAIFYGSMVFAVVYVVFAHGLGWISSPADAYKVALASYGTHLQMRAPSGPNVNEGLLANGAHDSDTVERGASVFAAKCIGCHTADGRGQIGPNLTDLFQIHGSSRMDLYDTINRGIPGTAMPPWGEQLSGVEVVSVTVFVSTLRGKNLVGKAAQGAPVKAFE